MWLGVHVLALQQTVMVESEKENVVADPCRCPFLDFLLLVPEALDDTVILRLKGRCNYDGGVH